MFNLPNLPKSKGEPREVLSEIDLSYATGKLKKPDQTTEEGRREKREREIAEEISNARIETARRERRR